MSAASFPEARLIAASILSFGRFSAFALAIARRSAGFMSGSGPPFFAARVIDLASLGKTLDILSQRASLARRRHSKARPMMSEIRLRRIESRQGHRASAHA